MLIADAMLGSLARKLRIFGFDTLYFRQGTDSALMGLARDQRRIVLTSDRDLADRCASESILALLVQGKTEQSRIRSIVEGATRASVTLRPGGTRCPFCNVELSRLSRPQVESRVPGGVLARHRLFYGCELCGKLYWKGGHWSKLRRMSSVMKAGQ